jgi:crotonobetainyl-CoA:carnitine CoA-transferase CaiB-like acyl-CoA transferase
VTNALLADVRVIDLTRTIAGPSAAQILGDFGADVIKLERPGGGDEAREIGPTFLKGRDGKDTGEGSMYLASNRNKRGMTVDLAKAGGQEIVRRLAAHADILIENYKTGDLARYGLDYASLRNVNPDLIYCSVTGYGQTGPYAARPGYDPIFQALAGWMSVNGVDDQPTMVASNPVDTITGYQAAMGILAALRHRDRGGGGQQIDVSLYDVAIAAYSHRALDYLMTGEQPRRRGMKGFVYTCSDGLILVGAANADQWGRFCEVLGAPELLDDPRYNTYPARVKNAAELAGIMDALAAKWTVAELTRALDAAKLPSGAVYDFKQVFADPHVRARGMEVPVSHPLSDDLRLIGNPLKYSATPIEGYAPPPLLGQHTEEILSGLLHMSAAEIAALREEGAI